MTASSDAKSLALVKWRPDFECSYFMLHSLISDSYIYEVQVRS